MTVINILVVRVSFSHNWTLLVYVQCTGGGQGEKPLPWRVRARRKAM